MSAPPRTPKPFEAPYTIRHGWRAISDRTCKLERHEILHLLRGQLEHRHREDIWCYQVRTQYRPEIDQPHSLSPIRYSKALDFWNKSVPIYVINGDKIPCLPHVLLIFLHNYLYGRWFRPYRSEIEYGQFIAKAIYAEGPSDTRNMSSVVSLVTTLNKSICSRLDETRQAVDAAQQYNTDDPNEFYENRKKLGLLGDFDEVISRLPHYIIRPLFEAVAIAICGQDYTSCRTITENIAQIPVLIVLTGRIDGLSAPITFDSIETKAELAVFNGKQTAQTCLDTAVDFIMNFEAREEAAFGPQPDPATSTAVPGEDNEPFYGLWFQTQFKELGGGDEILVGPSSKWIDMEQFPNWTGGGADMDDCMKRRADQEDRTHLRHPGYKNYDALGNHIRNQ